MKTKYDKFKQSVLHFKKITEKRNKIQIILLEHLHHRYLEKKNILKQD